MSLNLFNTLTGKKEEFQPIHPKKVSLYHCGPTVYNYAHVGNLRAYVFADILRRTFEYNDYSVEQVINITDVGHLTSDADDGDDKMTKALLREGKPKTLEAMREVGEFYANAFLSDLKALNVLTPDEMPRASDHIAEDIEIIKILESKGIAYRISEGIYFDISKYSSYGKFGKVSLSGQKAGARVVINSEKRNPADFALWKLSSPIGIGEARNNAELTQNYAEHKLELGWESPWGKGFPGWHIECSAMSRKYLGQPFDIHTGGVDHIPVHHQNEIAQSESAFGIPLANFWMHSEFVNISGEKMAKSEGNFLTLGKLSKKISPLAYRFYLLGANYRTPMDLGDQALEGAKNSYNKLCDHFLKLPESKGKISESYTDKLKEALSDDLNTPVALSLLWKIFGDEELSDTDKRATILDFDRVLGLGLEKIKVEPIPKEVQDLIEKRMKARKEKDWEASDLLRTKIEEMGYEIRDEVSEMVVRKI